MSRRLLRNRRAMARSLSTERQKEKQLVMNPRDTARSALLLVGALLVVVSGLFTLTHLTDTVIWTILVPGFVAGLILLGLYWRTGPQAGQRSR